MTNVDENGMNVTEEDISELVTEEIIDASEYDLDEEPMEIESDEDPDPESDDTVEPVVEEMKSLCGVEYPASFRIPDEEVENIYNDIQNMTTLEVMKYLKDYTNDYNSLDSWEKSLKSSEDTYKSLMQTSESMHNFVDKHTNKDMELTDDDGNPIDFDKIHEELKDYREFVTVGMGLLKNRYEEIRSNGPAVIIDDILESLDKNVKTLEISTNPNKEFYTKYINKVIEEITPMEKGTITLQRLYPKLDNPKRLKLIIQDLNKEGISGALADSNFTTDFVNLFIRFMEMERIYCGDNSLTFEDITKYTNILFYHLARIIRNETKHSNYLSIIYKCYVLRVLEIGMKNPDDFSDDEEKINLRKSFEEGTELKELSDLRQATYNEYKKIFNIYAATCKKFKL